MNTNTTDLGFKRVKVAALAVSDMQRAMDFYGKTLGLPPHEEEHLATAFKIGDLAILLKHQDEWYGRPTADLNARLTIEVKDAYETEKILKERGVTITDPVEKFDRFALGSFVDSEGNKLWFCSG